MNARKRLESRIRGWLPKESNLPKPHQRYAQPTTINQKHITREPHSRKQTTGILIFASAFALLTLAFVDFQVINSIITWQVAAIYLVIGLIAGWLISSPFIKRQLKLLREKGEINYGAFLYRVAISLAVVVAVSGITGFLFSYLSLQIKTIYADSFLGGILGFFCSWAILFFKWEKTYRMRIYGTRDRLYAISQNENPNVSKLIPELKT
ncbi:MAG: hypothetical protein ABSG33_03310 [Candidatus Bathyarchaeia archaeon]|jgi:hypothetical protein